MKKLTAIGLILLSVYSHAQTISTYAGTGVIGNNGDNGLAINAELNYPVGGAFDRHGNFYFTTGANGNTIRKITPEGIISTVAGVTNTHGDAGEGGLAINALLHNPQAVITDTFGNIYIADAGNNKIKKVDILNGIITTIAGTGSMGNLGDGSLATQAQICNPLDLCFDKNGNLYIASNVCPTVRKINPSGIITTIAGTGISGYNGDGGLGDTTQIIGAWGLCTDDSNNVYIADGYSRILKVNSSDIITTFAGNGIPGYSGDGNLALNASTIPAKIAFDREYNMYIGEYPNNYRVRKINSSGIISTVVGDGTPGFSGDGNSAIFAQINWADGVATDSCGNLYVSDLNNYRIRKVSFNPSCWPEAVPTINSPAPIGIYPNPATTSLTITGSINKVQIINMLGQTVYTNQYSNTTKATIDISSLPTGVYFVKGNEGYVQKVVKE